MAIIQFLSQRLAQAHGRDSRNKYLEHFVYVKGDIQLVVKDHC